MHTTFMPVAFSLVLFVSMFTVQACISKSCSMSSPNSADLFNSQISLSSLSDSDKETISSFCSDARNLGNSVIKQFLPTLKIFD